MSLHTEEKKGKKEKKPFVLINHQHPPPFMLL